MRFDIVSLFALAASTVSAGPLDTFIPSALQARTDVTIAANTDATAQNSILTAHNNARSACGVKHLVWDNTIARSAQNWANGCRIEPLTHSRTQGYGENLAANTNANLFNMVWNQWIGEVKYYNFNNPEFSKFTGHFTQAVWASTTKVGCGWSMCRGQMLLVCQYSPPGNIGGNNNNYRQNVKPMSGRVKARGIETVFESVTEDIADATSSPSAEEKIIEGSGSSHQHHRRHQHLSSKRHARELSVRK